MSSTGIAGLSSRCTALSYVWARAGFSIARSIIRAATSKAFLTLLILAACATLPLAVSAQGQETRSTRVEFAKGSSSIRLQGGLTGREMVLYQVRAAKGQVLTAALSATNAGTSFNLYAPGKRPGDQALAIGNQIGTNVAQPNSIKVTLPSDGVYTLSVFLYRAAARRGESTRFTIDLAIRSGAAAQLPAAPGNQPSGLGSAYLAVAGLAAGDRLNMRAGPSTSFGIVERLPMGEVVRNLGCSVNQSGQSWCEVHRIGQPRRSGWASATYLRPARAPDAGTAAQLPGQAPVTTSGRIRCEALGIIASCPYTVIRRGNGNATLTVTLLPSVQRRIEFSGGRPINSTGKGEIFAEWKGSDVVVMIGGLEKYIVPNTILFGG